MKQGDFKGLLSGPAGPRRSLRGLQNRASYAYFAEGWLIALVSCALFLLAIYGHARDYSHPPVVRLSQAEIFLPFFPTMLSYGVLALTLGLVQPRDSRRPIMRVWVAAAFGLGTLLFLHLFYFLVSHFEGNPFASLRLRLVYAGGCLVIASLALDTIAVLKLVNRRIETVLPPGPQQVRERSPSMTHTRIYLLGGFTLTLATIAQSWWNGMLFWFFGARPVSSGVALVGTIAHPTSLALGVLAVLIGLLHLRLKTGQRWQLVASVSYMLGAVLFVGALYLSVRDTSQVRPDVALVVGATLLMVSIGFNAYSVMRTDPKGVDDEVPGNQVA